MRFLERLADRRIQEAIELGDLDDLPGAGKPIPEEPDVGAFASCCRSSERLARET